MGIKLKKAKGGVTFVFAGCVGIEHAVEFHGLARKNAGTSITVDLREAESVDTSIAQIILALGVEAKRNGEVFQVIKPPALLLEALSRTGGLKVSIN